MKNQRKKISIGLASLVLILVCAVGGTLAWMAAASSSVTNTFTPAKVTTEVVETLGDNVKSDVKIKNTGDVDAFIRAAVVINLVDENGNVSVANSDHYQMTPTELPKNDWFKGTDGYYYYPNKVAAGDQTTNLFDSCTPTEQIPDGWHLQVTILAEGIQADGTDAKGVPAVELAWKTVTIDAQGQLTQRS